MSEQLAKIELLEKVDDEFGNSPSYWTAMLKIAFDANNYKYAEELVDRCMCSVYRRVKTRKGKIGN